MRTFLASALLLALALVLPGTAFAHGGVRAGQPFPTNLDSVRDHAQATGLRVDLAKPSDCVSFRSDCEDVDVLNQLDGFNMRVKGLVERANTLNLDHYGRGFKNLYFEE
jgi:hypothetical protein